MANFNSTKAIGSFILSFFSLFYLHAQRPNISTFSPQSGPIGTEITISGSNFDTTPANNIVFFGGVQAEVVSSTATELIAEVPIGASYDYISVNTGGLIAQSSNPFIVSFESDGNIGLSPDTFADEVTFVAGDEPYGLDAGDLDGDGLIDLVTGNFAGRSFSVFRNTSTGSGSISFASKSDFALVAPANDAKLADFDGDGKLDLAMATEDALGNTYLEVFRNTTSTPGSISFTNDFITTHDGYNYIIDAADFNGDGKIDIVVLDSDNAAVSVYENSSTTGTISFEDDVDFTIGSDPYDVTFGDINADGMPDIITLDGSDGNVSVLENTSTGGSISFAAKVDFALNLSISTSSDWVEVGDLNDDGLPEVLVKNNESISIFKNESSASLSMASPNELALLMGFGPLYMDDFNGDGIPDLLTSGQINQVVVLKNTSSGSTISFDSEVKFNTSSGYYPLTFIAEDLDGDGETDIVVSTQEGISNTDYKVEVLRNHHSKSEITAFSFAEQLTAATIDVSAKTIEISVDGVPDLTTLTASLELSYGATATVAGVSQTSGVTSNDFTNPVTYTVLAEDGSTDEDWTVTVVLGCSDDVVDLTEEACGNYDFDGDLITSSGIYTKLYTNVTGCDSTVTVDVTIHPVEFYSTVYAIGEYDFDGTTLTTSGQYTYGPFTGSTGCDSTYVLNLTIEPDTYDTQNYLQFQLAETSFEGIRGANYLGDLDGDTDLDIILVGRNSNMNDRTRIYLNAGDGTFTEKTGHGITNVNTVQNACKLIDIDEDNDLDFIMFGLTSSVVTVSELYLNDGSGNFTLKADANLPLVSNGAVDVGDVDGDDDLDLLIQGIGSGAGKIWLNNGNEVFSESAENIFPRMEQGSIDFGDVDGDNDLDVFMTGSTSGPTIYYAELFLNDGTGSFFKPLNQDFLGIDVSTVELIDFDKDGDLDLFTSGDAADAEDNLYSILYFNDGSGNFRKEIATNIPEMWGGQAVFADLDADGDEDLVLAGEVDDDGATPIRARFTGIYLNNGYGNFTETDFCAITDLGIGAVSVGDLDGDGRLDMVMNGYISQSGEAATYAYFNKVIANSLTVSTCESYEFDGMTLTVSGNYQGTFMDEYGCSYPVNLDLTILEPTSGEETVETCESYDWNGVTYTTSGIYQRQFTNEAGCDSTATLNLTILESDEVIKTLDHCGDYTFGSQILTESGVYMETFMNQAGCDSTVTLTFGYLTEPFADILENGVVLFAETDVSDATYQWYDCDTDEAIVGEDKQQLTPPRTGNYYVAISNGVCTSVTDCAFFDWVLATQEVLNEEAKVFPTVTDHSFTLDLNQEVTALSIRIMTLDGKVVQDRSFNSLTKKTFEINGDEGMYLVQVWKEGQVINTQRIIKK